MVSTEWLEVDDVNKMNEQLIEGVRSAAYKKIGCVEGRMGTSDGMNNCQSLKEKGRKWTEGARS